MKALMLFFICLSVAQAGPEIGDYITYNAEYVEVDGTAHHWVKVSELIDIDREGAQGLLEHTYYYQNGEEVEQKWESLDNIWSQEAGDSIVEFCTHPDIGGTPESYHISDLDEWHDSCMIEGYEQKKMSFMGMDFVGDHYKIWMGKVPVDGIFELAVVGDDGAKYSQWVIDYEFAEVGSY